MAAGWKDKEQKEKMNCECVYVRPTMASHHWNTWSNLLLLWSKLWWVRWRNWYEHKFLYLNIDIFCISCSHIHSHFHFACKISLMMIIMATSCYYWNFLELPVSTSLKKTGNAASSSFPPMWAIMCLPVTLALSVWNPILWMQMTQRKFEKM